MPELDHRVAVVTGGGGSLGRGSASALAARGAAVAVVDIDEAAAERTAQGIRAEGGRAIAVAADMSGERDIATAMHRTVAEWGRIDILHNNVADMDPTLTDTNVLEIEHAVFQRILTVNVISYAIAAKHAIPHMIERGGGVIVNTASVGGHTAELERVMYNSSKAAVIALTKSIATQHGRDGIRAVSISPGVIETPGIRAHLSQEHIDSFTGHTPVGRLGSIADVSALVAFLASPAAAFISGTDVLIDGGMLAHAPTVADEQRWAASLEG